MSHYRKPRIPYEIKNAREWDPNKHLLPPFEDDEDEVENARINNGWETETSASQAKVAQYPTIAADEGNTAVGDENGFQKVVRKSTKRNSGRYNGIASKLSSTAIHKPQTPVSVPPKSNTRDPGTHTTQFRMLGTPMNRPLMETKASISEADRSQPTINTRKQWHLNASAPAAQVRTVAAYRKIKEGTATLLPKPYSRIPSLLTAPYKPSFRPVRPIFSFERDNAAKRAFRQRRDPCGSFELHKDIIEIEPDVARLENVLQRIGTQFESYIRPPRTAHDRQLLIWGDDRQFAKTKAELALWIRQIENPKSRPTVQDKFGDHVHSVISTQYKTMKKETAIKAKLAHFQQNPDPKEHFDHGGLYRWPNDEVNPQELFGSNLEAFDPVRYMNRIHIVFDERLRMIRLYTNRDQAIRNVLKIIEGTLKEFYARGSLDRQTGTLILVDLSQCSNTSRVGLKQLDLQHPERPRSVFAPVLRQAMSTQNSDSDPNFQTKANSVAFSSLLKMQRALDFAMSRLTHFRGRVSMKVMIGTFALETFKWPPERPNTVDLDLFLKNMTEESIKGAIIRDVYPQAKALDVLKIIQDSNELFEPLYSVFSSLYDVSPMYKAKFTIVRFEKPTIVFEIEWTSGTFDKHVFTKTKSSWSYADDRAGIPPLSLYNLRLGSSLSSVLQVSQLNQVDKSRIDGKMEEFATSVKLNPRASIEGAENDGRKLVIWETDKPGCLKPSQFEQTICYQYRVKDMPEMIFEIARQDSFDPNNSASNLGSYGTQWAASLWNSEWDIKFSQNTRLGLGEKAKWNPSVSAFFPGESEAGKSHPEIQPGLLRFVQNLGPILERLDDKGKGKHKDDKRKTEEKDDNGNVKGKDEKETNKDKDVKGKKKEKEKGKA